MRRRTRRIRIAAVSLAGAVVVTTAVAAMLGRDRADVAELGWPYAESVGDDTDAVTVTWLGISTLLFDDGETQILTDGMFTRVRMADIFLLRRVSSDIANINHVIAGYGMSRIAAIVPLHSHFDHAMDAGLVANRTNAVILGSESTANIARGARVPVDQYQILASGESRKFGEFTITLLESKHAPTGIGDEPWFPGVIEEALEQPARIPQWREGVSYSLFIAHPRGTALIQASGGFVHSNLEDRSADVVMLGIAGLAGLGPEYVGEYWRETVTAVGANRVFPIHYDDFTRPFGEVALFPDVFDRVAKTAAWLDQLAGDADPVDIRLLPFGKPVVLY